MFQAPVRPDRGERLARLVILALLVGLMFGAVRGAIDIAAALLDWMR